MLTFLLILEGDLEVFLVVKLCDEEEIGGFLDEWTEVVQVRGISSYKCKVGNKEANLPRSLFHSSARLTYARNKPLSSNKLASSLALIASALLALLSDASRNLST